MRISWVEVQNIIQNFDILKVIFLNFDLSEKNVSHFQLELQ